MNEINQNKESIKDILNKFNISKVVYVDDYNVETSVEKVISSPKRDYIFQTFFPELLIGDIDIENARLKKQWENINYETKIKIKLIIESDEKTFDIDRKAIPVFDDIIPNEILLSLSPENWEKQKNEYLLDSKITLFLFDQDLKRDGRDEGGIKIIKEISTNKDIICGLFTQKAAKDDYFEYRDKMCEEYSIDKDKFFVIPKENVTDNQQLFLYLLKLTILGRDFTLFKTNVNKIIEETNEKTKERIENIKVEDFDHIIFKVPKFEGLWEPDMFFRIYSGFQRREFINLAYSNVELKNSISKIRSVSNIPTKPDSIIIPSDAWNIQHDELYDNAEYLNNNHLPIEVGDIFENTNKGAINKYILLSQPCDLMIRAEGKRSRAHNRFTLLKIKKTIQDDKIEKCIDESKKLYEQKVWYFGTSKDENWVINFKDIFLVKDYILDLCVYNDDGISKYSSKSNYEKEYLCPSLLNRYIVIKKMISEEKNEASKIITEILEDGNNDLEKIEKVIYESKFNDDLFKSEYKKNKNEYTINYNCKRIGRLTYERAIGLLAEFHSVMARPGYPPDYGQEKM